MTASTPKKELIAFVALGLLDLRAQCEAQARFLNHAETALLRCRDATDDTFAGCIGQFRSELRELSEMHNNARDLLDRVNQDALRLDAEPGAH